MGCAHTVLQSPAGPLAVGCRSKRATAAPSVVDRDALGAAERNQLRLSDRMPDSSTFCATRLRSFSRRDSLAGARSLYPLASFRLAHAFVAPSRSRLAGRDADAHGHVHPIAGKGLNVRGLKRGSRLWRNVLVDRAIGAAEETSGVLKVLERYPASGVGSTQTALAPSGYRRSFNSGCSANDILVLRLGVTWDFARRNQTHPDVSARLHCGRSAGPHCYAWPRPQAEGRPL